MAEEQVKRKGLGRGLSALLGDDDSGDYQQLDKVRMSKVVPVEFLHPGRYQPRHKMDDGQIADLAESIRHNGILQPILVRRHPVEANAFEIIAGERRWRAAQQAELHEVPVVIKDLSDSEAMEIALVENLQRQDLSPLEEAEGYSRLLEEFQHTQEQLAGAVGKSRSHVANMMRLLSLPEPVKDLVDQGQLSAGHARALLNAEGNVEDLAREVVKKGLNVRQTEKLARKAGTPARKPRAATAAQEEKDADTLALERDLSNLLGLKVDIRFKGGGGTITLHYGSLEQLDDILHRLSHAGDGAKAAAAASEPEPEPERKPEPEPEPASEEVDLVEEDAEAAAMERPEEDLDADLPPTPAPPEPGSEPDQADAAEEVPDWDADEAAKEAERQRREVEEPGAEDEDFGSSWVDEAVRGEIDMEDDEDD